MAVSVFDHPFLARSLRRRRDRQLFHGRIRDRSHALLRGGPGPGRKRRGRDSARKPPMPSRRPAGPSSPDRAALRSATARDGVVVPELVRQLRAAVGEPHAASLHYGATSQDVVDTSLSLRLVADPWSGRASPRRARRGAAVARGGARRQSADGAHAHAGGNRDDGGRPHPQPGGARWRGGSTTSTRCAGARVAPAVRGRGRHARQARRRRARRPGAACRPPGARGRPRAGIRERDRIVALAGLAVAVDRQPRQVRAGRRADGAERHRRDRPFGRRRLVGDAAQAQSGPCRAAGGDRAVQRGAGLGHASGDGARAGALRARPGRSNG